MSIESSVSKLTRVEKDLRRTWGEIAALWRDDNSRRFEQTVISPLITRLRTTSMAMGRMATALRKARQDCE